MTDPNDETIRDQLLQQAAAIDVDTDVADAVKRKYRRIKRKRMAARSSVAVAACLVIGIPAVLVGTRGNQEAATSGDDGEITPADQLVTTVSNGEPSVVVTVDDETSNATTTEPQPPDSAGAARSTSFWGNAQIASSLAPTRLGAEDNALVAFRIKFPSAGELASLRVYTVYKTGSNAGDGTSDKGDGGTFTIRLEADDGSASHSPSGDVLGSTGHIIGYPARYNGSGPAEATVGGDSTDSPFFRNIIFETPIAVEADTYYHVVFENTSSDPTNNYISIDAFSGGEKGKASRFVAEPLNFGFLKFADGVWQPNEDRWAIGEYHFTDGTVFGNGYMEVGRVGGPDRAAQRVDGSQTVRQRFVPPSDMTVNAVSVGAAHIDGDNKISFVLKDSTGNVLGDGVIDGFPSHNIVDESDATSYAEFRSADLDRIELNAGQEYFLELSSVGGVHTITGTRDGSVSYNFDQATTVDGFAEIGSDEWSGWPLRGGPELDQFDISFYFSISDH